MRERVAAAIAAVLKFAASALSTIDLSRRQAAYGDRQRPRGIPAWQRTYLASREKPDGGAEPSEQTWSRILERERDAFAYALIGQLGAMQRFLSALPEDERAALTPVAHQHFFVLVDVVSQLQSDLPRQTPDTNGAALR